MKAEAMGVDPMDLDSAAAKFTVGGTKWDFYIWRKGLVEGEGGVLSIIVAPTKQLSLTITIAPITTMKAHLPPSTPTTTSTLMFATTTAAYIAAAAAP
jgi:hypothetical protein